MPIYEYRCNACQREFEYQQKMSDPDLTTCEVCGEPKLEKLISWTSVRTNNWQSALSAKNPREAMKGLNAVDRSRPPKKDPPATGPEAAASSTPPAPAPATTTAPAASTPQTSAAPTKPAAASTTKPTTDDDSGAPPSETPASGA